MLRTLIFIALSSLVILLPSVGKGIVEPSLSSQVITKAVPIAPVKLTDSPLMALAPYPYAPPGTYSNDYAFGNCTSLAASMVRVPNSLGNANSWDDKASTVSSTPVIGMIAQTDAGWAGHVGVVIAVNGSQVLIEEANYQGFNIIDERWTNVSDWVYLYF